MPSLATLIEIAPPPNPSTSAVPLILIHDGGGTIFQYYMLGQLDRAVFGISNPYHDLGTKPAGGVTELARDYLEAICREIGDGEVIVGGWSFGGLISLEVARLVSLASQPEDIQIRGLLLLDSLCPWSQTFTGHARPEPSFLPTTSEAVKVKVRTSFANARAMIAAWERPAAFASPPVVLLRAEDATDGAAVRGDEVGGKRLGWEECASVDMRPVVDVPGGHFSMWNEARLDNLTVKVQDACRLLERAARPT